MTQEQNDQSTSTRPLRVMGATATPPVASAPSPASNTATPGAQTLAGALPAWDLLPAQPFIRRVK